MKIFVGYGYNDRDKWVEELVFPIIQAFGDEVISGKEVYGKVITEAVKKQIEQANALIGFTTRRDKIKNKKAWTTHTWVKDEITTASVKNVKFVEVRESDVQSDGITGDRQFIKYNENERDKCLVELVKAIGQWHSISPKTLMLLPTKCVEEIRPYINKPGLSCKYKLYSGVEESALFSTKIIPINPGGLIVNVPDVPSEALIQLNIEFGDKRWSSSYESTDLLSIHLLREE